jgi:hypothetical protein
MLADTYVWSDAEDSNLYGEWDFEVRMFPFILFPFLTVVGHSSVLVFWMFHPHS